MSEESVRLLAGPPLEAAVAALAKRNQHHFASMSESEREEAMATWRGLAADVLTAAGSALDGGAPGAAPVEGKGRAAVIFEDAGEQEVTVHASFHPDLQDLGDGQVSASPSQAMAIEWLNSMTGAAEGGPQQA